MKARIGASFLPLPWALPPLIPMACGQSGYYGIMVIETNTAVVQESAEKLVRLAQSGIQGSGCFGR